MKYGHGKVPAAVIPEGKSYPAAMEGLTNTPDLVVTALFAAGLFQLSWISVLLARRALRPMVIQQAIRPLFAIWVLLWPVYTQSTWLWLAWAMAASVLAACAIGRSPFWLALRHAWGLPPHQRGTMPEALHVLPMGHFLLAMAICLGFFVKIPEFGFGLGLALCLAIPGADTLDRLNWLPLGFPTHPEQTLAGHLLLVLISCLALSWGLHVYHDIDITAGLIATAIAGIAGSMARATVPGAANQPATILSMGVMLWLL
ncbi:MAG: hypothetical protein D6703_02590 [Zetaproteobacteria bacterium]|nr:MAG: hypothetical protein D6703_02590 [Zetaproteobacteria bacterium]